jgi:ParB-like chromosome segregation protein Spo0J
MGCALRHAMTDQLRDIPVDHISPNPRQPRTVFDEAVLNELAASISARR